MVLTWSWEFRSSERRQAKQPNVASWCEEGLTIDACYMMMTMMMMIMMLTCADNVDVCEDDDADSLRKTDAYDNDDDKDY